MKRSLIKAYRMEIIDRNTLKKYFKIPKPLIPYPFPNGKPIIEYILDFVEEIGIREKQLLFQKENTSGNKRKLVKQNKPLGTAHALKCALPHINSKLFLVMSGNGIIRFRLEKEPTIYVKKVKNVENF